MTRRKVPRDYQRTAVYRWQVRAGIVDHSTDDPRMSLGDARALAERVWHTYPVGRFDRIRGSVCPSIKAGRRNSKRAGYWHGKHAITLPPWALQPGVVLHEVAHAILYSNVCPYSVPAHGPEFVRLMTDLATSYMGRPAGFLDFCRHYAATTEGLPVPLRCTVDATEPGGLPWQ